jgi:hypothetical protein
MTPLTMATRDGDIHKMNALINSDGNINERDPKTGWTALHYAIQYNRIDAVTLLIEKGANVNIADEWGYTPLILALQYCRADLAKTLIERGANINTADGQGWTPLALAVYCDNKGIVNSLLEKGADIEIADRYGSTPLMHAALYGHTELAKLLIENGADIDAVDDHGSTPLIEAIKNGHTGTAKLLIEEGANVRIVDSYGHKASYYAKPSQNPFIKIFKASDIEQKASFLKLLEYVEMKQISQSDIKTGRISDKDTATQQIPRDADEITQQECARIPLQKITPEERARTGKIAVLPARFLPKTDALKPYDGMLSGAGRGAAQGAEFGVRLGPGLSDSLGALVFWPALIVACAATGAVVGAVIELPTKEKMEMQKAYEMNNKIKKILLDLNIQEEMARYVQAAGKRKTGHDFIVVKDAGPSYPEDKPDYTVLVAQGIDAVIEIAVNKITVERFGKKGADLYCFNMIMQARLVHDTESCTQEFKYMIGPPRTSGEWIELDAAALQKEVDNAYTTLAEDTVGFVFVYTYLEAIES